MSLPCVPITAILLLTGAIGFAKPDHSEAKSQPAVAGQTKTQQEADAPSHINVGLSTTGRQIRGLPADWASHIRLELSAKKPRVVLYEPIWFQVRVFNSASVDLPAWPTNANLPPPRYLRGELRIRKGRAPERRLEDVGTKFPDLKAGSVRSWSVMLKRDDQVSHRVVLGAPEGFMASVPGSIRLRYLISLDGRTTVTSNTLEIKVTSPTQEDQQLLAHLPDLRHLLYFYGGAMGPPVGLPDYEGTIDFLEDLVKRFPNSSYTPYGLARIAGIYGFEPSYPRTDPWINYDAAYDAVNEVLKRFPQSPLAPGCAVFTARMLQRLGRLDELKRRTPEFKAFVGDDHINGVCLRLILEGHEEHFFEGPIQ